ncbi:MAG: protein adenylyltransferase SelO [Roseateles sp.]|uniref:protein adenylyltransferase SelO n=1 Tax=Roseateles sp. TaxID=1971397 RepID=UPI004036F9F8
MQSFGFDNTYARELPGTYAPVKPATAPAPRLLFANLPLAQELGLPAAVLQGADAAALFVGNLLPPDAEPIAQAYAGHQFGGFSPQLGDGRALLLGELVDRAGRRRDIAYKGSGRTPFSRGGDGKAAVGPMLREVLMGEAMHALGIPTTRALAVAATGELVRRDTVLPGAVLTRVAASHLRVGSFQFFAARGELEMLSRLADYTIARHDPGLIGARDRHLGLLRAVAERQALLVAQWLNVGFIHGVMNTDNMALSGETIDYGPCAFMEAYDPAAVFSSIDHNGRYAYANQPAIARWNLARFAETLLPLMADADDEPAIERAVADAMAVIDAFPAALDGALLAGQQHKLGLTDAGTADDAADAALAADWLTLLHTQAVDFTLAWRHLASAAEGRPEPLRDRFADRAALDAWLARWQARCARYGLPGAERAQRMRRASPAVIPRNHLVEEALTAATAGDLAPFDVLLAALRQPWDEAALSTRFAEPAATDVTAGYRTFCGT